LLQGVSVSWGKKAINAYLESSADSDIVVVVVV